MSRYLSFIFIALLFTACKKDLYTLSVLDRKKLQIEELDFDYFSGKSKITYLDVNRNLNANSNIRIRKDSIIWVSITSALGIEMFRAMVLNDSIHVIDRINKAYYVHDFNSLNKKIDFNINYNMIEAMLFGNLIHPRLKTDKVTKEENYYILAQKNGNLNIENYVNSKSMKIEEIILRKKSSNNHVTINYQNFQPLDIYFFPYDNSIELLYNENDKIVNTQVNISYNKAAISSKKLRFPFNVPNKYESD